MREVVDIDNLVVLVAWDKCKEICGHRNSNCALILFKVVITTNIQIFRNIEY